MNLKKFLTSPNPTPAFLPVMLLLVLMVLVLTGCAVKPPPDPNLTPTTLTKVEYVAYECGQPPGVTHVSFDEVEFVLVEIDGEVVWTLTAQEYSDLGQNMSDIIQASKELNGNRKFWRACVLESLKEFAKLNAN